MANNPNDELQPPVVSQNPLDFGPLPQGRRKTWQVLISNPSSTKTLLWRADTDGMNWVTSDPMGGSIQPKSKPQLVNVTVDASSLAVESHPAATLTFTSEGDNSSASAKVPITLTIPQVLPPTVGLSFALFLASSKTLPLAITNQDNQPVNWTADTGGTNWLTLDRNSGTLKAHEVQTLYVTANSSSLTLGDYAATLTFSSAAGSIKSAGAPLPVELHISLRTYGDDGPHAALVSQNFNPRQQDGKNTISLRVTNPQENGQVKWTMGTGGVNWVTLKPSSGILRGGKQATVQVTTDKSGLQAGNYRTDLLLTFTFDTDVDPTKVGREPTSVTIPFTMTVP